MIGFHIPLLKNSYESVRYFHENSGNLRQFQLFVKNPRQMGIKTLKDEESVKCRNYVRDNNISLFTHASYLLNMANPDKWEQKINCGKNEIDLAEQIGSFGVVFHVGKHLKLSVQEGEDLMYQYIHTLIQHILDNQYNTKFILETSAHCGTELCWRIEDLGRIFHRFTDLEKEKFGICIDTCHIFSAGYPIHTDNGCDSFIQLVQENIGWENVSIIHLNDSLSVGGCGCKADRHANIMKGFIGNGMRRLIEHTTNMGIPHVLETPVDGDDNIIGTHLGEIEEIQKWF